MTDHNDIRIGPLFNFFFNPEKEKTIWYRMQWIRLQYLNQGVCETKIMTQIKLNQTLDICIENPSLIIKVAGWLS